MKALFIFLLFSIHAFAFDTAHHAKKVAAFVNDNASTYEIYKFIALHTPTENQKELKNMIKGGATIPKLKVEGSKIISDKFTVEVLEPGKVKVNDRLILTYNEELRFEQNLESFQRQFLAYGKTSMLELMIPQAHAIIIAPAILVAGAAVVIAAPIIAGMYYYKDWEEGWREGDVECTGVVFTVRQKVERKYLPTTNQIRELPLHEVNNILKTNFRECTRGNAKMLQSAIRKDEKKKAQVKAVLDKNSGQSQQ